MPVPSTLDKPAPHWNAAQLRRHFGMIPAARILDHPRPGTATEEDLLRVNEHGDRLCELVDGVLVEKAMGASESLLTGTLIYYLMDYLMKKPLGILLAPDGALRLMPGLVRAPDISFISWDTIGAEEFPNDPIPALFPDLAVEVLSKGNTKKEMERMVADYLEHGTRLVWLIHPGKKTVEVVAPGEERRSLGAVDSLDGGPVLPGYSLPLKSLFTPPRRPKAK